nr:immunoglobulin light chain junction region [Macaca mulatta]
CQQSNTNPWTF